MSAAGFPYLSVLTLAPLLGALVVGLLPRGRPALAKQVALGWSVAVLGLAVAMWIEFDPLGCAVPVPRVLHVDSDLGRAVHVRGRRHRTRDDRPHRAARTAGDPLLLARGRGPARRPGAPLGAGVLRARARPGEHDDRRLRRGGRLSLLCFLRDHARADVLPHRLLRWRAPAVRRREVLPLLPRRWAVHARRGGGTLGPRWTHLRLGDAYERRFFDDGRAVAVPRVLRGVRHQGAVLPVPHLAARRGWRRPRRRRGAARRRAGQGGDLRDSALLPAVCFRTPPSISRRSRWP